jgi:hypothetical protein
MFIFVHYIQSMPEYSSRCNDSLMAGRAGPSGLRGRSAADRFAGIAGSNPAGGINVYVLCVLQSGQRAKTGQSSTDKVQREWTKKKLGGGKIFRCRPDGSWGPHSLLHNGYRGRGVDHTSAPSAEVNERVELYIYSSSVPSWPVPGRSLLLFHTKHKMQKCGCGLNITGLAVTWTPLAYFALLHMVLWFARGF